MSEYAHQTDKANYDVTAEDHTNFPFCIVSVQISAMSGKMPDIPGISRIAASWNVSRIDIYLFVDIDLCRFLTGHYLLSEECTVRVCNAIY